MAVCTSWLRTGAGMVLIAGLLGLGSGCKRSSSNQNGTVTLSGAIAYSRLPVVYDGTGAPTGQLGPAPGTLTPARGVLVRVFQGFTEYDQSGQPSLVWRLGGATVTDSNGAYNFSGSVYANYPTFVEVDSVYKSLGTRNATVQVLADSNGLASTLPEPNRPIYAYRVDGAGNLYLDPTSNSSTTNTANPTTVPGPSGIGGDTTLNITLQSPNQDDKWAVTTLNWYLLPKTSQPPAPNQAPLAILPIGSEALGIVDSVYLFASYFGDPTPSVPNGGIMDLHWYPGRTEMPRRSFVVYDPSTTPLASDGVTVHSFATLAGGGAAVINGVGVDDGWDPGVIYPMLARNSLFGQGLTTLYPTGTTALPSLSPDLALVDGLADAMAAAVLQSPYLTDTTIPVALQARDIRNAPVPLPAPKTGATAPASLAAAGWSLVNYENNALGNQPNPFSAGTPAQWVTINGQNLLRFFALTYPTVASGSTGSLQIRSDIPSVFQQLARLGAAKSSADLQNLVAIFPNSVLFLLMSPENIDIPWTLGMTLPTYTTNWGQNPGFNGTPAAQTTFTLSMANAGTVPNPLNLTTVPPAIGSLPAPAMPLDVYPNVSADEVAYAELSLTVDRTCTLTVTPQSALPPDATIEVVVDGAINPPPATSVQLPQGPFYFPNAQGEFTATFQLIGNPPDYTNPIWHYLRIRLLSPAVQQPDPITFTVSLQ